MFFFFCFVVFPEGFYKTKKSFEKTTNTKENQRTPTKKQTTLGKTNNTKFLKVSDSPLDMGLFFVCFLVFPKVFTKPTNYSRKPQIPKTTKENQQNIRTNKTTTKLLRVSASPLDMVLFFCLFGVP